jgi:hypothetical protein
MTSDKDEMRDQRGEQHLDDRSELAYVYDGVSLRAVLYNEREIERYRTKTTLTVNLTPDGEDRLDIDRVEERNDS